ncbi:hypothetical protein EV122DRAFT_283524 [Schizophyllum commune]
MLDTLPVELLYEVQLFSLSSTLPLTCKRLHSVFKCAPASYQAQYLLGRVCSSRDSEILTRALRYPVCSEAVLDIVCKALILERIPQRPPELPKRLFRGLDPSKISRRKWTDRHYPLPFLRHMIACLPLKPDCNAHHGYALTRAVHAQFIPLVAFLLEHGASPKHKNGMAVQVAIRQRNLPLVRMLLEREGGSQKGKRRRMEDRTPVTKEMLRVAVKSDARDIVDYLTREKGCIPDMQTLMMMSSS